MRSQSIERSSQASKVSHLPQVGEVISVPNGTQFVPANYSVVNSEQRWITYAIQTENGWELSWNPYKGLAVFLHKKDFKDLQNFPWVQKVEIVKQLKSSVVARVY